MTNHSDEAIKKLLNAKEGENYEFKEAKNSFHFGDAVKYCCALANCGGGKLVFGITDKRPRKIVGSKAFSEPERTRKGLIEKLHIKVDFQLYEHDGKRILVFEIACRPLGLPVQADGIVWWRDADSLIPMPQEMIRSIYDEAGHDFSGDICEGATLNDLDKNAIEDFRKRWADKSENARIKTLSNQQLLSDCGAIIGDKITYAALILFGKTFALERYLPHCEIVFEYRSANAAGPAQQREEFRIGFFACYDKIWELINLRNDKQHYQDGFFVLDILTFNERVAREAILNAVSHRSYQLSGCIFVKQYRDRLVVESPGGFPSGITVDNILHRQAARNRKIAGILSLCGLVERAGQGMNLMYELSVKDAKPLPDFAGSDAYFVMLTLNGMMLNKRIPVLLKQIGEEKLELLSTDDFLLIDAIVNEKSIPENLKPRIEQLEEMGIIKQTDFESRVGRNDGTNAEEIRYKCGTNAEEILTQNQRNIIELIRANESITAKRIANQLSLGSRTVEINIGKLKEMGYIVRRGEKKGGYWEILK